MEAKCSQVETCAKALTWRALKDDSVSRLWQPGRRRRFDARRAGRPSRRR